MLWEHVRAGFEDELEKIAAVSTRGLSPETLMSAEEPPPMETAGFQKARDILSRAETVKVAKALNPVSPGISYLKDEDKKDPSVVGQAKSLGGHTIGGAAAGRLVGFMAHGPKSPVTEAAKQSLHGKQWYGTAAGAAIGAGTYAARKLRERAKAKTAEAGTPGRRLRATQQVAARQKGLTLSKSPSLRHQVAGTIGKAGRVL